MRVQNNTTPYLADNNRTNESQKTANSGTGDGNIFAGDLNLPTDKVMEKRLQAQEQAMKLIMDAFAIDQKIDNDLEGRRQKIRELESNIGANNAELKRISDEKEALIEKYGLDDEATQAELDLLIRHKKCLKGQESEEFTENELKHLEYLYKDGRLLEYQERLEKLNEWEEHYTEENEKLTDEIIVENKIINAMMLARDQLRHMLDAQEGAEDILNSASEEIKDMIHDDSVEHIKDEAEKQEKRADEIAEKQKEQQEFIEKIKDKKEEDAEQLSKVTKNMLSLEKEAINIQAEAKKILNKLNLIEDDIKGAVVDKAT